MRRARTSPLSMTVRLKEALLLTTMFFGMVFMLVPDDSELIQTFPLTGATIYTQTWFWYVGEHLTLITLSAIIASEKNSVFRLFLAYQILDLIDFVLTGNAVWTAVYGLPVSMNTTGVVIFALVVIKSLQDEC